MKKLTFPFLLFLFLITTTAAAQVDTLRVATYNLLKFTIFFPERIPYFRTVVHNMAPDILIVQELDSQGAQTKFLNEVLNFNQTNIYERSPIGGGFLTKNSLFYKKEKVSLLSTIQIKTDLRDISEYTLSANGVEFKIYSLHLKAGQEFGDENQRQIEANILRNHLNNLPANSHFIVGGDFNITRSSEPAFVRLTESEMDNDGRLFDPLKAIGTWHDNPLFASLHTQSTRDSVFNDGSDGGLDDRYDMLLISRSLMNQETFYLLPGSYTAVGNDGRHFNLAVNDRINTSLPDSIVQALFLASDHLPVYADFIIDQVNSVENPLSNPRVKFILNQNYPNPFNAETQIIYTVPHSSHISLNIYNVTGQKIRTLVDDVSAAGVHRTTWNGLNDSGQEIASGIFFYRLEAQGSSLVKKLILLR
ncbi:MAG: endonuclease/exonuclease/phosphatase family protein [bacterium]